MCTAKPLGSSGCSDLILSPSHAMLTIHEIVAHATEVDRIMGYEANYAGTSFVKISDIGKLKYGSKLFNITADKTDNGLGSVRLRRRRREDARSSRSSRDGILVGLQTNRETAHYLGENVSRGCTFANSWRDYPFLRMPNVHLEPGPAGLADARADHRRREERRDDRRPRQLLDRPAALQRPVRRPHLLGDQERQDHAQVTNVTYNAITTDFWGNLDAITGQGVEWQMYGTGGDAKGQPTQTNSISHGSPWLRIRKIMVGAAFD